MLSNPSIIGTLQGTIRLIHRINTELEREKKQEREKKLNEVKENLGDNPAGISLNFRSSLVFTGGFSLHRCLTGFAPWKPLCS